MMDSKVIWIKTGYEIFAQSGPAGLKIESLAKKVGISKSSFYHHFADLELFTDDLLNYHIQQSYVIANVRPKYIPQSHNLYFDYQSFDIFFDFFFRWL